MWSCIPELKVVILKDYFLTDERNYGRTQGFLKAVALFKNLKKARAKFAKHTESNESVDWLSSKGGWENVLSPSYSQTWELEVTFSIWYWCLICLQAVCILTPSSRDCTHYAPPSIFLCLLLKVSWDNPYLKILDLANLFVADVPMKKINKKNWLPSEQFEISVQKPPMHERVNTFYFLEVSMVSRAKAPVTPTLSRAQSGRQGGGG